MIAQATELIRQRIGSVVALSGVYETEPWGVFDTPQQDFLNQALLVETPQNAHEVLHEALEIEAALGRVRKGDIHPSVANATAPLSQGSSIKKENVESAPLSQGCSLSSTTLPLRQGEYPEGGRGWNWQRGQCPPRIYSSRPMDIDLIFFNDEVIDTPELTIPHPRMHLRQFVLEPLAEIMPDYRHPVLGLTVKKLLDKLNENP